MQPRAARRRRTPVPGGRQQGARPGTSAGLVLLDRFTGEHSPSRPQRELETLQVPALHQALPAHIPSIDENVGRLLDWLDEAGLAENTIVSTPRTRASSSASTAGSTSGSSTRNASDAVHRSLPGGVQPGRSSDAIATNVDFAPTFLDYAGVAVPSYMQGHDLRPLLEGRPADWQRVAYHRYWMHKDEIHYAYAHYGIRTSATS